MKIEIDCASSLKKFLKQGVLQLENRKYTVEEVITISGFPRDEVGFATINGKKEDLDFLVSDNDMIKLYPTIISG